jgi:hypothetical protein
MDIALGCSLEHAPGLSFQFGTVFRLPLQVPKHHPVRPRIQAQASGDDNDARVGDGKSLTVGFHVETDALRSGPAQLDRNSVSLSDLSAGF